MNRLRKSAFSNRKIKNGIIGMFFTLNAAMPLYYLYSNTINNHYKSHLLFGKKHLVKTNELKFDAYSNPYYEIHQDEVVEDSVHIFKHTKLSTEYINSYMQRKSIFLNQKGDISPIEIAHLHVIFKNSPISIFIHQKIRSYLKHINTKPIYNPLGGIWYKLRMCESGNNYSLNTGNGYYGAYQFALLTWWSIGFTGLPNQASPATQDKAAMLLQKISGWVAWPQCASNLGLLN